MENNNQPPFAVGQKVVCVASAANQLGQRVIEGNTYTIADCRRCKCGKWSVVVEEINGKGWYSSCPWCSQVLDSSGRSAFISAHRFAPLNPPRVSAIPELLKQPVAERLDIHKVPETIKQ